MAQFSRLDVLNRIIEIGLMPVFYHRDAEVSSQVALACAAGGATAFEFTNRGDGAVDVFKALIKTCRERVPNLILGAGSITDEATAALYVAHGSNFIVGPSFNPAIARFCNRRKIAYIPGCLTPTEIATAEESGVEIVKVFPCEAIGDADFAKAILGPSPWTKMMLTGLSRIDQESVSKLFAAGIVAFGIGQKLIQKEHLERQDYQSIARRTAEILGWICEARK